MENKSKLIEEKARELKREYYRSWREKNKEHIKNYHTKWRKENPDKVKAADIRHWEKMAKEQLQ